TICPWSRARARMVLSAAAARPTTATWSAFRRAGADPRTLGSAISRRDSLRAWLWRGHARPQCPLLQADSNLPAPPTRRFAKSQTPKTRGLRQPASPARGNPLDPPRGAQEACNRKKILNRGNELKVLLKTQGLTE